MTYTIKNVSEMTSVPVSTLRYYDKRGLFPFLKRDENNRRVFTEMDISSLQLIECLKKTGMSIEDIKKFSDWVLQGDSTLQQRLDMFCEQENAIENQIAEMQKMLEVIRYKKNYYQKAVAAGTELHLIGKGKMPYFNEFCRL